MYNCFPDIDNSVYNLCSFHAIVYVFVIYTEFPFYTFYSVGINKLLNYFSSKSNDSVILSSSTLSGASSLPSDIPTAYVLINFWCKISDNEKRLEQHHTHILSMKSCRGTEFPNLWSHSIVVTEKIIIFLPFIIQSLKYSYLS